MEVQDLRQSHCEAWAMAENKYQQQLAQQGARLQEQHEACMQRLRDAAASHQTQLEALQAQLDSQVHSDALPAVCAAAVPPAYSCAFSPLPCNYTAVCHKVTTGKSLLEPCS